MFENGHDGFLLDFFFIDTIGTIGATNTIVAINATNATNTIGAIIAIGATNAILAIIAINAILAICAEGAVGTILAVDAIGTSETVDTVSLIHCNYLQVCELLGRIRHACISFSGLSTGKHDSFSSQVVITVRPGRLRSLPWRLPLEACERGSRRCCWNRVVRRGEVFLRP